MGALWTDDSVLEFPFAPTGAVNSYVGREAILAYMSGTAGEIKVNGVRATTVHPLLDPSAVIVELQIDGTMASTGAAYDQRYVAFFKLQGGRIAVYREYWNPLITIAAVGGYDAYLAKFYGEGAPS